MRRIFRPRPKRKVGSSRDLHVSHRALGGGLTLESRRLVWTAIQESLTDMDNEYVKYLQQVILNLKFGIDIDNSKLLEARKEAIRELVQRIEKYIPRP